MSIYIKVNGTEYPAVLNGKARDGEWDNRETKTIRLAMSYEEALAMLPSGTPWSVVQRISADSVRGGKYFF